MFNLCIQTNSLLPLIDFDLGISLGNLFDVKYVTLKSIDDSVSGLTYILYVAPVALQTIYKIVTLACAFGDCIVGCIIVQICYFPCLGNPCTILTSVGSCTPLRNSTLWLWYLCPNQHVLQ